MKGQFADYLKVISTVNHLCSGMEKLQWLFHCGMLFSSRDKWWGDFKFRSTAHEGIDITYYRIRSGSIQWFDDTVKVPAMSDGTVLNVCDDFLGQTVVVEKKSRPTAGKRVLLVYAHVIPQKGLKTGERVKKGSVIATVCHTKKNPLLPPHLHLSCFEVSTKILPQALDWTLFSNPSDIRLIHPVFL